MADTCRSLRVSRTDCYLTCLSPRARVCEAAASFSRDDPDVNLREGYRGRVLRELADTARGAAGGAGGGLGAAAWPADGTAHADGRYGERHDHRGNRIGPGRRRDRAGNRHD
ncbi:hypothetical protein GCM10029963_16570 [Micromonospora andamanensis]